MTAARRLILNLAQAGALVLIMTGCATETRTSSSDSRYSSVTAPSALFRVMDKRAERKQGVAPEHRWNGVGIWQKVADEPPTYVAKGYAPGLPRTEAEGTWFVDKRDGKRLFVPHAKVNEYEPATLRREAGKVTDWIYK